MRPSLKVSGRDAAEYVLGEGGGREGGGRGGGHRGGSRIDGRGVLRLLRVDRARNFMCHTHF